jgi:glycosyltransferase involved in cell wall biosynthesis
MPQLSVIVPVYNEAATIKEILEKIDAVTIDKEIIVVDDSSTDGTDKILRALKLANLKIIHHSSNRGKGAAFLTGLANATGDFVIVQDADLEYNPNDYLNLMEEIKKDNVGLVLGARFTEGHQGDTIPRLGNKFVTSLLNFLFGVKINDILTCYKLLRRQTALSLNLESQGFCIDTELIIKVIKKKLLIKEVPVSYSPRTYAQGKKIRARDGLAYILNILKYRLRAGG